MALYSVDSQSYVDTIPHREDFDLWRSRLTEEQFDAICDELRSMIDGSDIYTAGWMPGNNWIGTPWEPIYTEACRRSREASGNCFGLFVWVVLLEHPDTWGFGRYEKDGLPIRSMTYFRLDNPPPR